MNWLDRLLPPRARKVAELDDDKLTRLFARVHDHDACLLAVTEMLSRHLLQSAATAGSLHSDDTLKLRACERMECFRLLLIELEQRREQAREWAAELEEAQRTP